MLRLLIFGALLARTAAPAVAATLLEQKIDHVFRTTRAIDSGAVGIDVVQLGSGKLLYSRDSEKLFTPASNAKLFTSALALTRLGPDYRMHTRIIAPHAPGPSGRQDGDLAILGAGDPSMTFLPLPFDQDAPPANPMAAIEALADQVVARGVRGIAGDVVADDTAFPYDPFPPGWDIDDALWDYGAPVSALALGDNSIRAVIAGGAVAGSTPLITLTPALEYYVIDNRLRTVVGADNRIEVRRMGGRQLRFTGNLPPAGQPTTLWLAVDDPALYAATALYDALTRRGVVISGHPAARHAYDPASTVTTGEVLAERFSPPLVDMLRVMNKVSQNLWAEMLLREVARSRSGDGSRPAALRELQAFLREIRMADQDYSFEDGSGLSRMTLVSPAAVVRLLAFMHASPARDAWASLLPVGGLDGTLADRFGKDPAARNIHAKTGSLTHVNALAGYADSATYGQLAFSILVNNTSAPASEIRRFIDRIGMILLE